MPKIVIFSIQMFLNLLFVRQTIRDILSFRIAENIENYNNNKNQPAIRVIFMAILTIRLTAHK